MVRKKFYKKEFDKATKSKIEIFREYFKESFPVFIYSPFFENIMIFDFFAGQGQDKYGNLGIALSILDELKPHCEYIIEKKKKVELIFNDKYEFKILHKNVNSFIENCRFNCEKDCLLEENLSYFIQAKEFHDYFLEIYPRLKSNFKTAKLLYLDPCNFIIDKNLFTMLTEIPSADFLCFMPSSFLRRFPQEPTFKKYIDTNEIDFKTSEPAHCHRVITDYFQSFITEGKEYYLGCFSIKKGANYYGLLFGSNHTLGAEKFQRVCWKKDDVTGEADYNIDRELIYDKGQSVLFDDMKISRKIKTFRHQLKEKIYHNEINTDLEAYKFALQKRCLVKHSADLLKDLMKEEKISKFKTRNNDIHKIKEKNRIVLL